MSDTLKQKTISGFLYKFFERAGAQFIKLFVSIILARILLPNEYAVVAVVITIITILDVFVTYGFGNSLVKDKNSDQIDFSTCFYFGIALAVIIYLAVFFVSPYIANWLSYEKNSDSFKYDVDLLTNIIRVMSLRVPFAAINSVQHAYVQKHMMFKKFFYSTLIGTIISGVIAVVMAFYGCGAWSLVEQYLGNVVLDTIFLWIIVKWRPSWTFSFERLKKIFQFGWKVLAVGLLDVGYGELRSFVIAKRYSPSDLAYYQKGNNFPTTGMSLIEPTVNTVLFSSLSKCNDDQEKMKQITRRVVKMSTFLTFPMIIGMAAVAKPFILLLLTSKWLNAVIYMQIGCAALLFRPIQFINNCVIKASGKGGLLLTLDIIKKAIGVVLLIAAIPFGVEWIAISLVVTNVIATLVNVWPNKKLIKYGYLEQFKDIFFNLLVSLIMGVGVYFLSYLPLHSLVVLIIQILSGIVIYFLLCLVTRNENLFYSLSMVKKYFKPRNTVQN